MSSSVPHPLSARSSIPPLEWEVALVYARRRALNRTVQSLFREGLLDAGQLIHEGTVAWLPLWGQQALLRLEGLKLGPAQSCRMSGAISLYRAGQPPRLLDTPSALLAVLGPSLGTSAEAMERMQAELENSVGNDALALRFRRRWQQELRIQIGAQSSLFAWLWSADLPNPVLLLEQWGCIGHPWHPTFKAKMGLSREEVMALSPEFQPQLPVPVLALRREAAGVETAEDTPDYSAWFAAQFPAVWQAWRDALQSLGFDERDWVPLPAHPFQAERVLPQRFAEEWRSGRILQLPGVALGAAPTMSFRTMVAAGPASAPHIKLPVSLRMTTAERTVSPKSVVMGPRITVLLKRILTREAGFEGALDILGEEVGVRYLDPQQDDDRARHLSVLFRENPMLKGEGSLLAFPVGALFADSPLDGRPLVTELVASFGQGPLGFYRQYLNVALRAVLGSYLLYGIAFEAHQQNSLMLVDRHGCPRRLLLRDFGDLRVHRPTLASRGEKIDIYREGHTAFDDELTVRDKLLHAGFVCHFVELGLLLAREYDLPEEELMALLRCEVEATFEHLQSRTAPVRWQNERTALLEADWPAKSLLRMRLSDTSDDVVKRMPNPLRID